MIGEEGDDFQINPFLNAAKRGYMEQMEEAYQSDQSIAKKADGFGRTALHFAAAGGHKEAVEYAIKLGLDVNAKNNNGDTPLHLASWRGSEEVLIQKNFFLKILDSHRLEFEGSQNIA